MIKRVMHGFAGIENLCTHAMHEQIDYVLYTMIDRQLNRSNLKTFLNDLTYLHDVYRDF